MQRHARIPHSIVWQFNTESLKGKQYLKDLDFIHENLKVDHIIISAVEGVQLENLQQCHEAMRELVEHAHKLGLRILFRQTNVEGFFNALVNSPAGVPPEVDQAQIFCLDDPAKAEGIVNDYELVADENGYAELTHRAKWARNKLRALRNRILKIYAFRKTGEGFYDPATLREVTDCARIIDSRTNSCQIEFDGGKELAGYTLFFMIVQYFNFYEFFDGAHLKAELDLMDAYADIPFDGICMDERGFLSLNTSGVNCGTEEPFRGRIYSEGQRKYYAENLQLDLQRLLFDMRYAPQGDEKVRIKAINTYFDNLRVGTLKAEYGVAKHAKELWGDDIYLTCHNTFHNNLQSDEIWHTACAWWDLPRDFGHTDENIEFAVRMGIMLAAPEPLMFDMFYSHQPEAYYNHIVEGAPFNCRQITHSYNDGVWGQDLKDKTFLKELSRLNAEVKKLDSFQTVVPKLDLLVIFGYSAQFNWYPDHDKRSLWDIDGSLFIQQKVKEMWNAGYRCALVPDYAITDGRIQCKDGKISFNGHEFSHCLFLYPKYSKKAVYDFLNNAGASGLSIAAVGRADIDYNGEPAELTIPVYPEYDSSILEKMACPKRGIPEGCIYSDGSFALVSKAALLEHQPQPVDMVIEGVRYKGVNTGILAWRNGLQVASDGGFLEKVQ